MRNVLILFFVGIAISFSSTVKASPSSDEYSQMKEGMFLNESVQDGTKNNGGEGMKTSSTNNSKSIITMEKILIEYKNGNYINVFDNIKIKAEEEVPEAQELLGIMYRLGQGTDKHPQQALKWLTKASDAEMPLAQYHLGILLSIGDEGVDKDITEALKWLKISNLLYTGTNPAEKEMISTAYGSVLKLANRREKKEALEKINSWLKIKNKPELMTE